MCPLCLTTLGLIVAGTASTGGLTALAVKLARKKSNERRNENVDEHDGESENSVAS